MSNKIKVKYGNTELFSTDYPYNALDIKYKNNIISTIYPEETVSINTQGKLCDSNFDINGHILTTSGAKCTENITISNELPYEELEYIESTGTQYIDTGIPMSSPITQINSCHQRSSASETGYILFGGYDGPYVYYICRTEAGDPKEQYTVGPLSTFVNIIPDFLLTTDIVSLQFKNNSTDGLYCNVNGVSASGSYVAAVGSSDQNHFLFAYNNQGSPGYAYKCKLFSFKVFVNNILTRDFVPVRRKFDSVVCLYDTVSKTFFTNQGTGDFIAGPTVTYSKLEYIESTGAQYIDTGLRFSYGFGCKTTFLYPQVVYYCGPVYAHTSAEPYYRTGLRVEETMNFALGACEAIAISPTSTATINTKYVVQFSNISTTGHTPYCIINGSLQQLEATPTTDLRANINLYLFAQNQETSLGYRIIRLYNIEFFNDSECTDVVKNFIPVKRSGSNECGLLDLVSHVFYRNLGTGEFIGGPEV